VIVIVVAPAVVPDIPLVLLNVLLCGFPEPIIITGSELLLVIIVDVSPEPRSVTLLGIVICETA
jgi:hypothetical protein